MVEKAIRFVRGEEWRLGECIADLAAVDLAQAPTAESAHALPRSAFYSVTDSAARSTIVAQITASQFPSRLKEATECDALDVFLLSRSFPLLRTVPAMLRSIPASPKSGMTRQSRPWRCLWCSAIAHRSI